MSESRPNRARLADYYGVRRDSGKISDAIESKSQVNIFDDFTYSKRNSWIKLIDPVIFDIFKHKNVLEVPPS